MAANGGSEEAPAPGWRPRAPRTSLRWGYSPVASSGRCTIAGGRDVRGTVEVRAHDVCGSGGGVGVVGGRALGRRGRQGGRLYGPFGAAAGARAWRREGAQSAQVAVAAVAARP